MMAKQTKQQIIDELNKEIADQKEQIEKISYELEQSHKEYRKLSENLVEEYEGRPHRIKVMEGSIRRLEDREYSYEMALSNFRQNEARVMPLIEKLIDLAVVNAKAEDKPEMQYFGVAKINPQD